MINHFEEHIKNLCPNIPDVLLDIATRDNINNNQEVQKNKFAALRAIAIWYLEHGNGTVPRGFRGEYCFANPDKKSFNDFLQYQKQDKTWMTDIELMALGELFGCSIVITGSKKNQEDQVYPLYNAGDQAPVLNFHNIENTHWEYINFSGETVKTVTDGNCGYNAFERGLQEVITQIDVLEKIKTRSKAQQDAISHETGQPSIDTKQVDSSSNTKQKTVKPVSTKNNNHTTESRHELGNEQKPSYFYDEQRIEQAQIDQTIIFQQSIFAQIVKQLPDPQELKNIQEMEKMRISRLPRSEQEQIDSDYKFALRLAMQENKQTICLRAIVTNPSKKTFDIINTKHEKIQNCNEDVNIGNRSNAMSP